MSEHTEKDVAKFMLKRLKKVKNLYQETVVYEIKRQFGDNFVYINENGNLAIAKIVLTAFRKLTDGQVVWSRSDRYWRFKEDHDDPNMRMVE